MTRRKYTECDICGERITRTIWAKFRKKWRFQLYDWGMTDINPVDEGWRRKRFDVCENCWPELLGATKRLANGKKVECSRCGQPSKQSLCSDCRSEAMYHKRG